MITLFNKTGQMFEFSDNYRQICIFNARTKEEIVNLYISNKLRYSLIKLFKKVIYDAEKDIPECGGTRQLLINEEKFSKEEFMTIDIFSNRKRGITLTFTLETLELGKQNSVCFLDININDAKRILSWLKGTYIYDWRRTYFDE